MVVSYESIIDEVLADDTCSMDGTTICEELEKIQPRFNQEKFAFEEPDVIRDYVQYLVVWVVGQTHNIKIGPPDHVDVFWCLHLLDTKSYRRLESTIIKKVKEMLNVNNEVVVDMDYIDHSPLRNTSTTLNITGTATTECKEMVIKSTKKLFATLGLTYSDGKQPDLDIAPSPVRNGVRKEEEDQNEEHRLIVTKKNVQENNTMSSAALNNDINTQPPTATNINSNEVQALEIIKRECNSDEDSPGQNDRKCKQSKHDEETVISSCRAEGDNKGESNFQFNFTEEQVRGVIFQKLDKVRRGHLHISGLSDSDYTSIISNENHYQLFIQLIAEALNLSELCQRKQTAVDSSECSPKSTNHSSTLNLDSGDTVPSPPSDTFFLGLCNEAKEWCRNNNHINNQSITQPEDDSGMTIEQERKSAKTAVLLRNYLMNQMGDFVKQQIQDYQGESSSEASGTKIKEESTSSEDAAFSILLKDNDQKMNEDSIKDKKIHALDKKRKRSDSEDDPTENKKKENPDNGDIPSDNNQLEDNDQMDDDYHYIEDTKVQSLDKNRKRSEKDDNPTENKSKRTTENEDSGISSSSKSVEQEDNPRNYLYKVAATIDKKKKAAFDAEKDKFTNDQVRDVIFDKLTEVRRGDLYMSGLSGSDYATIISNEKHYQLFIKIIADALLALEPVDDSVMTIELGRKNTKTKKVRKQLTSKMGDFVKEQIQAYETQRQDDPLSKTAANESKKKKMLSEDDSPDNHQLEGNDQMDEDSIKDEKVQTSDKKRKSSDNEDDHTEIKNEQNTANGDIDEGPDISSSNAIKQEDDQGDFAYKVADAVDKKKKTAFDAKKEEVLSYADADVRRDFYEIGFSKWDKVFLPVLQIGPYDVSVDSGIRDQWIQMSKTTRKAKRPMSRLVYWYGTPIGGDPYSFLPKKSIVSYEDGLKKDMHKLPAKIQKKKDTNKKLTKIEQQLDQALEEIKQDLTIKPEERWQKDFYEIYELEPNDKISNDEHELIDDDEEEAISQSSPSKPVKKRRKSKKEDATPTEPKKEKTKKKKKNGEQSKPAKKGKKRKTESPEEAPPNIIEDDIEESTTQAKPKKKRKKENKPSMFEADEEELPEDISSEEDVKDDDFEDDKAEDDNVDDEEYEIPTSLNKGSAKKKKKRQKNVSQKTLSQAPKKRGRKTNETKCQEAFDPVRHSLEEACRNKSVDDARLQLELMIKNAHLITPTYLKETDFISKMKNLLKQTFGNSDTMLTARRKEFVKKAKEVYAEKEGKMTENKIPKTPKASKNEEDLKTPKQKATTLNPKSADKEGSKPKTIIEKKVTDDPIPKIPRPHQEVQLEKRQSIEMDEPKNIPTNTGATPKNEEKHHKSMETSVKKEDKNIRVRTPPRQVISKPKQAFSLKGMIQPKTPVNSENGAKASMMSSNTKTGPPTWMKGEGVTLSSSILDQSLGYDVDRLSAMDSLLDAVECFTEEDKIVVKPMAVAKCLEEAAFDIFFAKSVDDYWERIHYVCAALAGKEETGTLAGEIVRGKYATAKDIIDLPLKVLFRSFEGLSI